MRVYLEVSNTVSNENSHAKFRDNLRFPRVPSPLMNKFGKRCKGFLYFREIFPFIEFRERNWRIRKTRKRVMENR